ncbi:MAG: MMPL family transporter [Deltaproteobacteria bacterium]|nr:MMPL family transporter [Deltaproteobacteria bacterium]
MKYFWHKLASFHEKYYWLVLILACGLTAYSLTFLKKFKIDTNLAALLPQDYKSVQSLNRVIDKLGGLGNFIVLVENEDLETRKKFVRLAAKEIEAHPSIRYVDYEYEKSYFKEHLLLYVDLEDLKTIEKRLDKKIKHEKRAANPFYVNLFNKKVDLDFSDLEDKYARRFGVKNSFKQEGKVESYFVNPDHSTIAFIVKPHGSESDVGSAKRLYAYLEDFSTKLNKEKFDGKLSIEIAGPFRYKVDEYNTIIHDVKSTAIFAVLGVILFLTFIFRQYVAVFFIAIPLIMGIAWTFALVSLFIQTLNLITAFLFVILFGLGVDFGIHMFSRYLESRYRGRSIYDSIVLILTKTGRACLTAAVTTTAAFYSLILCDFKGFSEMGVITGTGVLMTLFAIYVVLPPLLVFCEKLNLIKKREIVEKQEVKKPYPFVKPLLVGGAFLTLLSMCAVPFLELEYDFTNLRANLNETLPLREKIGSIFTRSQSPAVIIAENYNEALGIIDSVEDIIKTDKETPTIDSVMALPSIYPPHQEEKFLVIKRIRELLDSKGLGTIEDKKVKEHIHDFKKSADMRTKVEFENIPQNLIRQFEGVDGSPGYFVYIFPSIQLRDGREAIKFADDIRHIKTQVERKISSEGEEKTIQEERSYYPSSDAIVFADMLYVTVKDGKLAVFLCFFVIFLILLIDFKSFKTTLLVLIPLVCGIFWMGGIMFVTGMKLNFFNIVVIPSLIGIGIDSGVHIVHRYEEEGAQSLGLVLRQTGLAIFMTTFTTMIGFGGLLLAYHPGLKSLGNLAILGLATCLISALFFLPAAIQYLENRSFLFTKNKF